MKRRDFLGFAAKGALGAATIGIVGCNGQEAAPVEVEEVETAESVETAPAVEPSSTELEEAVQEDSALPEINWEMPTSWPLGLDTIFGGAETFAQRVSAMTGGRFTITPRAAGEVVPGLEILQNVQEGAISVGHTASYYYVGLSPVTAFGTALPFGLTARQQNAWLYDGGGLELLQEYYADRFNAIQFPAGNTGAQMGGWFNKEVNTVADLQGLNIRIPGLGGQVMDRLGATVQVIAGGEIYQALQTGAIDAAEWVGPYDDEKLGFQDVASFYYYPGWWEPGPSLEVQINLDEWNTLPEIYQEIIKSAAHEANTIMMARYDARNGAALERLLSDSNVELRPYSDEILQAAETAAFELYDEFSSQDSDFKAIFDQWLAFRNTIQAWHAINETRYLNYLASQ